MNPKRKQISVTVCVTEKETEMPDAKVIKVKDLADLGVLDDVAAIFRGELERVVKDLADRPLIENVRKIRLEFELNPKTSKALVKCEAKLPPKATRRWTFAARRQGLLFLPDDGGLTATVTRPAPKTIPIANGGS
jgi:hypothetical protein